jgi:hypothetical protein
MCLIRAQEYSGRDSVISIATIAILVENFGAHGSVSFGIILVWQHGLRLRK